MADTNRRALLGALALIPAASLITAVPIEAQEPNDPAGDARYDGGYEDGLQIGREDFALAWLNQWTSLGGQVLTDPADETKAWYFMPETAPDALYPVPADDLPDAIIERQRTWKDANYHGRLRALLDLLNVVPGGKDAVKVWVSVVPATGLRPFPPRGREA